MKKVAIFFCATACAAQPPLQTPVSQPAPKPDVEAKSALVGGRTVAGTVHFEGAPKPTSFSVSLSDRTLSFSSADGSYRLSGITDALATVRFDAPGFASANVYTAIPEQGEATVDVTLYPACSVRGMVRDAKGDPIGGALISVAHAEKTLYWFQRPNVPSASDGAFELSDVPPGKTWLSVGATGLARAFVGPIDVAPGAPSKIDVALSPAVIVSGKVRRGNAPVTDATVELRADRPDSAALGLVYTPAETDAEGRFTINDASPGARRLVVTVVNGEEKERGMQRAIKVDVPAKGSTALDVDLAEGDAALVVSFPSGERGELLVVQGKIVAERGLDLESIIGTVHYAQVGGTDQSVRFEHVAHGDHTLILMPPPDLRLLPGGCHCIQQQIKIPPGEKEAKVVMTGQR